MPGSSLNVMNSFPVAKVKVLALTSRLEPEYSASMIIDHRRRSAMRTGGAISEDGLSPDTQSVPLALRGGAGWVLADRYRVLDRVGSGGMAEVFRCRDELLARDVAVKVFRTFVDVAGNAASIERQTIEVQALAGLSHPNLVTVFDASLTVTPSFLVMELIDGPSLDERLADGPLPEACAREVGAQIADALSYVHARGMVHRDVKPANILLGADGTAGPGTTRARLSDFGIVRLLGSERMTGVAFTLGTASYLAPEQARGAQVGPPADVYSLGLVLIEALTGVRSFDGTPIEAVMARLTRSPEIPVSLPRPWPALLAAMTATDPAARPSSAQVAHAILNDRLTSQSLPVGSAFAAGIGASSEIRPLAAAGATAAFAVSDATESGDAAPRRRRGALLVLALAVIALIGIGAYALARPGAPRHPPVGVVTATPAKSALPAAPAGNAEGSQQVTHAISATAPATRSPTPSTSKPAPSSSAAPTSAPATPGTTAPTSASSISTAATGTGNASSTNTAQTPAAATTSVAG
jgi:hypothetical protein